MHLQSWKLDRGMSDGVIARLANGGAWLYVVTVVDEEVEETTTVPERKCECSKCFWQAQALGSCSQEGQAKDP